MTQATAAVPQKAGERSRIVWWAHVARALAALVVVFARFVVEFREQDALVKAFTYITPIPLSSLPTTFAYHVYQWPRENLYIDPGTAAVGMFFMLSGFVIPFALERMAPASRTHYTPAKRGPLNEDEEENEHATEGREHAPTARSARRNSARGDRDRARWSLQGRS